MADVNLASLNFKLILDDGEFNDEITRIKNEADALNKSLSEMLNVHGGGLISKEEHQSAMRRLREEFQEAQNQQKLKLQWSKESQAMATKEALDAQKIAQAVEKTNREKQKGLVAEQQLAAATQKKMEAEINATAATERKVKAERDAARAEIQRQTASINQAAAEERKLTATNNRIASQRRLNAEMDREGTILRRNHRIWNDMKNVALAYFSFESARRLVTNLVRVSAEFEKQRVSLHAILQDADGAERIFAQIKELAVQSPFQFKELVSYTKQLSAFSIPMNELYDTTKMLADVSAGLGVGMDRLVLAYGQIRSASFLRGQEVRQLTEAGIPILTELAKQFEELEGHAVSAGEVFDRISKRQVTFEMVEKVFKDMTSEGGKFYQMQEVLAQTLSGKISNLTDAYQIMFAEIGEKTSGILNGTVDTLRSIAENYEKIGKTILQLVAIYGSYRAALIAVKLVEEAMLQMSLARMAGQSINGVRGLAAAVQILTQNTKAYAKIAALVSSINPYALVAAATVALGVQIYNLATRTNAYKDALKATNGVVADFNKEVNTEMGNLDYLFSRLRNLNKESQEYKAVKDQIINQYGQYLNDVDRENLRIQNLSGVYDKLAASIKNASIEKAIAAGRDKISEFETGVTDKIWDNLGKAFEKQGLDMTKGIGKELRDYILGTISADNLSQAAIEAGEEIRKWANRRNLTRSPWDVALGENKTLDVFEMRQEMSRMRAQSKEMSDIYVEQIGFIDEALSGVDKSTQGTLNGWQQDLANIAQAAADAGANLEIAVDAQSDLLEVRQKLDKELKDSQERYEAAMSAGAESDAKIWEQRVGYLQQMASRLGMGGESGGGGKTSTAGSVFDTSKDAIDSIRKKIDAYRDLKTAYQSLAEYMPDSEVRDILTTLYDTDMASDDFDKEIRTLIADLYRLGDAGVEAANGLMSGLRDEELKKILDKYAKAEEASERYKSLMGSWEKFLPSAQGLDKVVSDYKKRLDDIEELRDESFNTLWDNRGSMTSAQYLQEYNNIHQQYLDAKDAALAEARENAEKEIEAIYKRWRDENLDFDNLSDKTIAQLGELKDEIMNFNFSSLSEDEQAILKGLLSDLENIDELFAKVKAGDLNKLNGEEKAKDIKAWKQLADSILDAAKSLKTFADASDNVALGQVADSITKAGELTKNVLNGFKNADIAGAVVAGVSTVASWLFDAATRAAQLKAELAEIAHQGYLEAIDERLKSADTIFGSSLMGHIRGLRTEIRGLAKDIDDALNTDYLKSSGKYTGDIFVSLNSDLQKYALDLNRALKDANGFFDDTTLQQIDEKYSKDLKKHGLYEAFTNLKDYNEKMKKLYEDLVDSVGDMFDELSGDIADSLIESLKATGSAVTDLEDVFKGLGDSIFKSMVQSYIIDEVLSKYKEEVMSWWTDETLSEADIASRIRAFADSVKQDIDLADERLTAMYEAFMDNSLLSVADSAKDKTVGAGIKSITEDTANLLASYINAIRADVAAIRQSVAAEGAMNLPTPTLAEYLTQIQANTYNNAVAAQAILENLQSMMTMSDGPALRVFM